MVLPLRSVQNNPVVPLQSPASLLSIPDTSLAPVPADMLLHTGLMPQQQWALPITAAPPQQLKTAEVSGERGGRPQAFTQLSAAGKGYGTLQAVEQARRDVMQQRQQLLQQGEKGNAPATPESAGLTFGQRLGVMLNPQLGEFYLGRLELHRKQQAGAQINQIEQQVYQALESDDPERFSAARSIIGKGYQAAVLAPELNSRVDNLNKLIADRQLLAGKRVGLLSILRPIVENNPNANPGLSALYQGLQSGQVPPGALDAIDDEAMAQIIGATTARQAHQYIDRAITTYSSTATGRTTVEPIIPGQPALPGQTPLTQQHAQIAPADLGGEKAAQQKAREVQAEERARIGAGVANEPLYKARPDAIPFEADGTPREDLTNQPQAQLSQEGYIVLAGPRAQEVLRYADARDALAELKAFYDVTSGKALNVDMLDRLRNLVARGVNLPAVVTAWLGSALGAYIGTGRITGAIGGSALGGTGAIGIPFWIKEVETQAQVAEILLKTALEQSGIVKEGDVDALSKYLAGTTMQSQRNVLATVEQLDTQLQARIHKRLGRGIQPKSTSPAQNPSQNPTQQSPSLPSPGVPPEKGSSLQQPSLPMKHASYTDLSPQQQQVYTAVVKEATHQGVALPIALGIARYESNFDQSAVSRKGALGALQLLPETAKSLHVNPHDLGENIRGGLTYYKQMLRVFKGNQELALAAYNAGPEVVKKYKGIPPYPETQQFVKDVLSYSQGQRTSIPNDAGVRFATGPSGSPLVSSAQSGTSPMLGERMPAFSPSIRGNGEAGESVSTVPTLASFHPMQASSQAFPPLPSQQSLQSQSLPLQSLQPSSLQEQQLPPQQVQPTAMQRQAQGVFSRFAPQLEESTAKGFADELQQAQNPAQIHQAIGNMQRQSLIDSVVALQPVVDMTQHVSRMVSDARNLLRGGSQQTISGEKAALNTAIAGSLKAETHEARTQRIAQILQAGDPGIDRLVHESLQGSNPLERQLGMAYHSGGKDIFAALQNAITPQLLENTGNRLWERFTSRMTQAIHGQVRGILKRDMEAHVMQDMLAAGTDMRTFLQQTPEYQRRLTRIGSLMGDAPVSIPPQSQEKPVQRHAVRRLSRVA